MELDFDLFFSRNYRLEQLSVYRANVAPPSPYVCRSGDKLFDRFFYIVRGTFRIHETGKDPIVASSGDILYLPYNSTYVSEWLEAGEYVTLNFLFFNSANRISSLGEQIGIAFSDTHRELLANFQELYNIWVTGAYGYSLQCTSLFWNILYRLSVVSAQSTAEKEYRVIGEGILYLENHYTSDVSTDTLAELCGVSSCTFRRLFRNYKGVSPIKYKNQLKMRKARELLESGEYTVSEACEAVGCPDIFYFSKLFLRTYGFNPSLCKSHRQSNNTNNN